MRHRVSSAAAVAAADSFASSTISLKLAATFAEKNSGGAPEYEEMYEQAAAFNITQTTGSTVNAYVGLHMDGAVCSGSSALDSAGGICASGRHGPVLVFTNCKMCVAFRKKGTKAAFFTHANDDHAPPNVPLDRDPCRITAPGPMAACACSGMKSTNKL